MLLFDKVSFGYGKQPDLLKELSFQVGRGEKVCLLGLNGSGKSTLLKLAAGLLSPRAGQIEVAEPRDKVGFVFQQPLDQIVTSTVRGDIVFTLENLGRSQLEMRETLDSQAQRFALASLLSRHPATLSAGEQQRTALAGVLAPRPELLLLDEPTSYLDYHGRELLRNTMTGEGLTVLAATQFPAEASRFERVLLLHNGAIAFDGQPAELWSSEVWRSLQGSVGTNLPVVTPTDSTAVQVVGLQFAYGANSPAIDDINLELPTGTITAVVGDSGSGKTTLGKLIAGLLKPQQGSIKLDSAAEPIERGSFVMQFPESQFFAETVQAEIAFGPSNQGLCGSELESRVDRAMELVQLDFEQFASRPPFTLSGGERRRVALASILALERPVLILDEPTAGLDWQGAAQLRRVLIALRHAGYTILLLTHDLDLAGWVAGRFVFLDQGRLSWSGERSADLPENLFETHFGKLPQSLIAARKLSQAGLSETEIEGRLLSTDIDPNL
ncbi:MAG: ATP-binding cassette domain-containing protein [bacterium]